MTRKIPSPPGWQRVASKHDGEVLRQYHPLMITSAKWCETITKGRLEFDDAMIDIQQAVVSAVREYAVQHRGEQIPGPLVNVVIRRHASKLLRFMRSCGRNNILLIEDVIHVSAEDERQWLESKADVIIDDTSPSPLDEVERAELDAACAALAYALRRNLSPAAFAVLHLRHIEELTPDEISALAGKPRKMWRRRLDLVKEQARAVLASLGIEEWEDITEMSAEDTHA